VKISVSSRKREISADSAVAKKTCVSQKRSIIYKKISCVVMVVFSSWSEAKVPSLNALGGFALKESRMIASARGPIIDSYNSEAQCRY